MRRPELIDLLTLGLTWHLDRQQEELEMLHEIEEIVINRQAKEIKSLRAVLIDLLNEFPTRGDAMAKAAQVLQRQENQ